MKTRLWIAFVVACILSFYVGIMFGNSSALSFRGRVAKDLSDIANSHEVQTILVAQKDMDSGSEVRMNDIRAVPLSSYRNRFICTEDRDLVLGKQICIPVRSGDAITWDMLLIHPNTSDDR